MGTWCLFEGPWQQELTRDPAPCWGRLAAGWDVFRSQRQTLHTAVDCAFFCCACFFPRLQQSCNATLLCPRQEKGGPLQSHFVATGDAEMRRCIVCRCHGQQASFLPEMSHFSPRQNVIHSHLLPSSQRLPTLCSFKLG